MRLTQQLVSHPVVLAPLALAVLALGLEATLLRRSPAAARM